MESVLARVRHGCVDLWYDMYLSDRVPLPINYNPQISLNDTEATAKWSQAVKASVLVSAGTAPFHSPLTLVREPDPSLRYGLIAEC